MKVRAGLAGRGGVRRRLAGVGAATAVVALGMTLAPASPALAGSQSPPGASHSAAPSRTADVMTRNLYLGSSLDAVIEALASGNPALIVGAATATWNTVQASDPAERMAAVADEIVAARPAAVGLQEVTTWSTYAYNPATQQTVGDPTVAYDFLELLLKALADRGVTYHAVENATASNFTSPPIPVLTSATATYPTMAVQLADRDVILRRDDVKAWNGQHGNFETILSLPQPGADPLPVDRGWGSADLRTKLATFRFVNAHTEAWGPEQIRIAQVMELFAAQSEIADASGELPMVYVGDYNSAAPSGGGYQTLDANLDDAWTEANGDAAGPTCCQAGDLGNEQSQLSTRIDLVMTSPSVDATRAFRTGTTPVDLPGDTWWASDHAGVVARLVIE